MFLTSSRVVLWLLSHLKTLKRVPGPCQLLPSLPSPAPALILLPPSPAQPGSPPPNLVYQSSGLLVRKSHRFAEATASIYQRGSGGAGRAGHWQVVLLRRPWARPGCRTAPRGRRAGWEWSDRGSEAGLRFLCDGNTCPRTGAGLQGVGSWVQEGRAASSRAGWCTPSVGWQGCPGQPQGQLAPDWALALSCIQRSGPGLLGWQEDSLPWLSEFGLVSASLSPQAGGTGSNHRPEGDSGIGDGR